MAGGRPRSEITQPENCVRLGEDLVKWATEIPPKGEKRLHLNQWYSIKMGILRTQWNDLCQLPEFRAYYEKAQAAIAQRYLDGTVNPSIAQRFLPVYFADLKAWEIEKAEIGKRALEDLSKNVTSEFRECMNEFKRGIKEDSSGLSRTARPDMETNAPILDKGCSREQS
jgi:hypothetical protein